MQSHSGFKQLAQQINLSIAMGALKAGDSLSSICKIEEQRRSNPGMERRNTCVRMI
jgi:DNA-binding transcriptional regulator YhcF (GntR family)